MNSWDHAPTKEDEKEAGVRYSYYAYGYLTTAQWMMNYGQRLVSDGTILDDAARCSPISAYSLAIQWIFSKISGIHTVNCGYPKELWYFGRTATHKKRVLTDADFEEMDEKFQRAFRTDAKPRWYGIGRKRELKKEDSESVAEKEASESVA